MSRCTASASLAVAALLVGACQGGATDDASPSSAPSPNVAPLAGDAPPPGPIASQGLNAVAEKAPEGKPMLASTSYSTIVFAEPRDSARRLGYLRLGATVVRSEDPVSTKGCKGGWYEIFPRGFVCAGDAASTDVESPVVKAASRRPDTTAALPYRYGFVRSVLPLYLRVPTKEEQKKSEFKLDEHLAWYEENKREVDRVKLGAWDVPLDERGVPTRNKRLGELGMAKNSLEVGLGVHFGGVGEDDPPPFWLEGNKRLIPNVSDFAVPEYAVFADRARRFTGLGFIGSFATGEESLNRRFAITTDLRLAPTTKVKPDTGSPFHGQEIEGELSLPLAFVREQGATAWSLSEGGPTSDGDAPYRGTIDLSGKQKKIGGERYVQAKSGRWYRAADLGMVLAPRTFPKVADAGEKWIEIAIGQQTLTLWEGHKPVYATLISSGKKEYATDYGEYRIQSKHVTATMDSDEGSSVGGVSTVARKDSKKEEKPSAPAKPGAPIPTKGDGEYGVTKRRGEGTYQLRDVPYIQYFNAGQALHASYWHDVFGKQRSHGCVNMSPIDAHRVFMWTEPAIPQSWHGVNTGTDNGAGTMVIIHE